MEDVRSLLQGLTGGRWERQVESSWQDPHLGGQDSSVTLRGGQAHVALSTGFQDDGGYGSGPWAGGPAPQALAPSLLYAGGCLCPDLPVLYKYRM